MYKIVKRIFDFIFSLFGLILIIPLIFIIIFFIKIDSKGPILFKQKRIGKNKTYFNIYKFRTMKINTPANTATHLLDNPDKWITKVGKILRKTSLDEIPQLINIIAGQMSFVGPRPALWNQYDLIIERDKYNVNSITPGITGLAQINGRDELDITEKAKLDGIYLKNMSFIKDMAIMIKTLFIVINKKGFYEGNDNKNE